MAAQDRRKRQVKARSERAKGDRGDEGDSDSPGPASDTGRTTSAPTHAKWSPKGRRSSRERGIGWGFVAVGSIIVVLNYISEVSAVVVLPGGHLEVYFILGLVIAGFGFWHTGVLDASR